jgi:hypothetical protein
MSTDREIRRGQRDRMIAAHRQRRYASRMDGSEEGSDFGERALQLEGPFDPGIPQIGDAHEVEGRHAGRLVDLADERGLVADVAGAVARAWAIGDSEASSSTSTACSVLTGGDASPSVRTSAWNRSFPKAKANTAAEKKNPKGVTCLPRPFGLK